MNWRIYAKWMSICLGIGLILVIFFGVSQGGIALSPIIIVISIVIGLFGSAIHSIVYYTLHGSKRQKVLSYVIAGIVAIFTFWIIYSSSSCDISEDFANERIRNHIELYKMDMKYLGKPVFVEDECKYRYEYESPTKRYQFIFTSYGKIHIWDYEAHGL